MALHLANEAMLAALNTSPGEQTAVVESWWIFRDSNPEPLGYEPSALTNCAKDPYGNLHKGLSPRRDFKHRVVSCGDYMEIVMGVEPT